jgi:hypothetical protein
MLWICQNWETCPYRICHYFRMSNILNSYSDKASSLGFNTLEFCLQLTELRPAWPSGFTPVKYQHHYLPLQGSAQREWITGLIVQGEIIRGIGQDRNFSRIGRSR